MVENKSSDNSIPSKEETLQYLKAKNPTNDGPIIDIYPELDIIMAGRALANEAVQSSLYLLNHNNWLRIGIGYNKGDEVIRIAWGAHPKYVEEITNGTLKSANQWLRSLGGGHLDLYKF